VADRPTVFNAVQLDPLGSQGSFVSTITRTTTEGGGGEWEGKGKEEVMPAKLQSSFDAKKGQHRVQGYWVTALSPLSLNQYLLPSVHSNL